MAVKTVTATLNGSTYTLTLNSSTGKYEATITAPSKSSYWQIDHKYPVTVTATDDAGNTTTKTSTDATLGSALQLRVLEKVAPTIIMTEPTNGAFLTNATPAINFNVMDDDSDVAEATLTLDGTEIDISRAYGTITGGRAYCYQLQTALKDGTHTLTINAKDNDGNSAVTKTITFTVDTIPPSLTVTAPTDNLKTNQSTLTVSGTTTDATSKPVTITVNGSAATVNSDGSWSTTVTLKSGANTITVIATDKAGKTSTVTRTVTLDTSAPVISAVTLTPNPVDCGKTFVISVTVTDE